MTSGRKDILGVGFDDVTMSEAVERALALAQSGDGDYVVTPNAEIVYTCRKDADALGAVNGASLVVPDGVGVLYASKLLGRRSRVKERVAGIDLGENILPGMARAGLKLYLLGAKPGVAEKARDNLTAKYPGLVVSGTHDGYFKPEQRGEVADAVRASGADVCFVCFGAPAQELFMRDYGKRTGAHLLLGLGGSMDHYAGVAERAPEKWRKSGFEWLYRFIKYPSRIGRFMRLPAFLFLAVFARIIPALRVPPAVRKARKAAGKDR